MIAAGVILAAPSGSVLWLKKPPYKGQSGEWVFPGGKVEAGETPEQAAMREAREELGDVYPAGNPRLLHRATTERGVDYTTLVHPVEKEFCPTIDAEHVAWCWAPLAHPPQPTHPGIVKMLAEVGTDVAAFDNATLAPNGALPVGKRAHDSFALDRETVRTTDGDGHLHVASSVVSAAQVNDYMAEEIPGWEALGLVKGRIYALLRDPVELEKAAATWHGKPLLIVHRGQTADDHDREVTVGSVSNPVWEFPNLKAELTVWDGEAITGIENGTMKDLSSGYRYRPVMEPGEFQGVHYDGRMVDIYGNHVAIVKQGRVIGAFVGDKALDAPTYTAKPFTVEKQGSRFFVSGQNHEYSGGGKSFGPESYTRAFGSRREAEAHAEKMLKLNREAIQGYNEKREARTRQAKEYLDKRKERGGSGQGSLFDAHDSAPDFDAIWEKIEMALDTKVAERGFRRLAMALDAETEQPIQKWRIGSDRSGCKEVVFQGKLKEVAAAKKKYADQNGIPLSAVWVEKGQ